MKSSAVLALSSAALVAGLQQCTGSAKNEGGNWFCGAVNQILYSNVGHSGSYKAVSNMGSDGTCEFEDHPFSGPMAPFNEELTALFRGPMNLAQFAVYNVNPNSNSKRDMSSHASMHARRHGQGHGHQRLHKKHADQKRDAEEDVWVTATIDGEVVSWLNTYHGPTGVPVSDEELRRQAAEAEFRKSSRPEEEAEPEPEEPAPTTTSAAAARPKASATSSASDSAATGDYTRIGYYNAKQGIADGIVFLGNYGGDGSGDFDNTWGNSLSYINSKANGGASSPQVLDEVFIPSNKEFAIYSDKPCEGNECGYYRPGSVAYHGFPGDSKIFLFEFDMPLDGDTGFNGDMPAVWTLNAKIPRTQQYGDCACWQGGCGEFDVFEILAPGDTKAKSTFHAEVNGGSSDYFDRPVNGMIKVATVFDASSGQVSVKILDKDVDFSAGLSEDLVQGWVETEESLGLFSLFSLLSG